MFIIQFSQFSSVAQSCLTLWDAMNSQHTRPPCPSPTLRVYSNSCPSSRWCHLAIWSSIIPFSSCPQSLPASGSFPMSQLFAWGGQSIGVSASASVSGKERNKRGRSEAQNSSSPCMRMILMRGQFLPSMWSLEQLKV